MSETKPKDFDLWPNSDHELISKERLTARYDEILGDIMSELDGPLRLYANFPMEDSKVYFKESGFTLPSGAKRELPPIQNQVFDIVASSIDFQTQATSGVTFDVSWPTTNTAGQFRKVGFALTDTGEIQVVFSDEAATIAATGNAGGLLGGGVPLGFIDLVCTDSAGKWKSATAIGNVIQNADIHRFSSAGGGGGSGGGGLVPIATVITNAGPGVFQTNVPGNPIITAQYWDNSAGLFESLSEAALLIERSSSGASINYDTTGLAFDVDDYVLMTAYYLASVSDATEFTSGWITVSGVNDDPGAGFHRVELPIGFVAHPAGYSLTLDNGANIVPGDMASHLIFEEIAGVFTIIMDATSLPPTDKFLITASASPLPTATLASSLITVAANTTINVNDGVKYVVGTAACSVTLPPSIESKAREITFKRRGAGIVSISSAELIDGLASVDLNVDYEFAKVVCDGTTWHIVG